MASDLAVRKNLRSNFSLHKVDGQTNQKIKRRAQMDKKIEGNQKLGHEHNILKYHRHITKQRRIEKEDLSIAGDRWMDGM